MSWAPPLPHDCIVWEPSQLGILCEQTGDPGQTMINRMDNKVDEAGTALKNAHTLLGKTLILKQPFHYNGQRLTCELTVYPDMYAAFWYHPDHLGSSSYITNLDGEITQHMEYLPFGETLVEEHLNSNNSPYKFNAKELDAETGNYYYGARYYDPKFSIWLSVDPMAESFPGWSPYTYVYNNPLNYTDSTGMCPDGDCPEETYIGKTNELPEVVITAKGRSKDRGWTSESLTDYNNTQEQYQKDYPEFAGMSDGEMVDHHEQKYGKEYRAWDRKVQGEYRLGQFVNRLKLALDDTGILDYSKVYLEFATGGEAAPVLGRTVSSSIPRIKSGASLFNSYYDDAAIALHHYGNAGFNSFKRSAMRGLSTPLNRSTLGFSGQRTLMNYGARPVNYFRGIYKYNHDVMNKGTLDTFMQMRDIYKYGSMFFK